MNRRRTRRFPSPVSSDIAGPSPDYHSEVPHDIFGQPLAVVEAEPAKSPPPSPPYFSPGPPTSFPHEDGLVPSPHTSRANSLSSNQTRITPPQDIDPEILPSLPLSRKSSTLDLRSVYSPSHMIMQSPFPNVPVSPSWMRPMPIDDIRTRHNDYYLEDGVVFLAKNTLFKVPRYMLNQESEVFCHLYSDQFEQGGKGSIDLDPIILEGVEAAEFYRLLTVIYPRSIPLVASATEHWTDVEWESVLRLAVLWQMPQVRLLAIEKISSCASSMAKIFLGKRYEIPRWIRAGFLDLCLRDSPLTEDEGSQLDWKDILKISRAREMIIFKVVSLNRRREWDYTKYGNCYVYKTSYDPARYTRNVMVHHILDEIFGLEDLASDIDSHSYRCSPAPSLAPSIVD